MDGRTASTTGSVRKGFEFGMDSSTASAAEVKGSEVGRGGGGGGGEKQEYKDKKRKE